MREPDGVSIDPEKFWERIGKGKHPRKSFLSRDSEGAYWKSGETAAGNFMQYAPPGSKTVMEYGSGDGRIARFVAPCCETFYCVDIAQSVLELARKELEGTGLRNVIYALAPLIRGREFVDYIYCDQVVQHNPENEQRRIIERIHRWLRVGGRACIHLPAAESHPEYDNKKSCMMFTREQVKTLAESVDWQYEILMSLKERKRPPQRYSYYIYATKERP